MTFACVLLPLCLSFLLTSASAYAKDLSVLFLGNSFTFLPGLGTPEAPALPPMIIKIVNSVDPKIHVKFASHTVGDYSFEKHYNDPVSAQLLGQHYDKVVLQGYSIEALDLPPWWDDKNFGGKKFAAILPKILKRAFQKNSDVTLYVNWVWDANYKYLQPDHPGLVFPAGTSKAGQKWSGKDKHELQKMIDASYTEHAHGFPVHFAFVGDAWLKIQDAGLAKQDEFYIKDDWKHPSLLGAFVTALVLARDVFKVDVSKNTFVPDGIQPDLAKAIQKLLAH